MDDLQIEARITALSTAVREWAVRHGLWTDAYLKSFQQHFDDEPSKTAPVALVLCFDNDLIEVFSYRHYEAERILEDLETDLQQLEFEYEQHDACTVNFYPTTNQESFAEFFHFRWICSFLQPDLVDASDELFRHFRVKPEDLRRIDARGFEVLLDAIFRNQGFRTELGSGQADGGVDIRLYQHDVIGEVQTLVQAKRYAESHPIRLDAVAALSAVVDDANANRGLFVTTSRFLPGVKKFAARRGRRIQLADSTDVARWCRDVEEKVAKVRSIPEIDGILQVAREGRNGTGLVGRIVCARWGYNMIINDFAVIVRETPGAVLLAPIKSKVIEGSQRGTEIADLEIRPARDDKSVIVARKKRSSANNSHFWGGQRMYSLWDGTPQPFDYMD